MKRTPQVYDSMVVLLAGDFVFWIKDYIRQTILKVHLIF